MATNLSRFQEECIAAEEREKPCEPRACNLVAYAPEDYRKCEECNRKLCPDHVHMNGDLPMCEACYRKCFLWNEEFQRCERCAKVLDDEPVTYKLNHYCSTECVAEVEREERECEPDDYANSIPRGM